MDAALASTEFNPAPCPVIATFSQFSMALHFVSFDVATIAPPSISHACREVKSSCIINEKNGGGT